MTYCLPIIPHPHTALLLLSEKLDFNFRIFIFVAKIIKDQVNYGRKKEG